MCRIPQLLEEREEHLIFKKNFKLFLTVTVSIFSYRFVTLTYAKQENVIWYAWFIKILRHKEERSVNGESKEILRLSRSGDDDTGLATGSQARGSIPSADTGKAMHTRRILRRAASPAPYRWEKLAKRRLGAVRRRVALEEGREKERERANKGKRSRKRVPRAANYKLPRIKSSWSPPPPPHTPRRTLAETPRFFTIAYARNLLRRRA